MSQMTIPTNFLPTREMSAVNSHAHVTQSQGTVWFLIPSQINKKQVHWIQNNLKRLGPHAHCWALPLLCQLQHHATHWALMNQTGQGHAVFEVPRKRLDCTQLVSQTTRQPSTVSWAGNQGPSLPLFPTSQRIKSKLVVKRHWLLCTISNRLFLMGAS